MSNSGLSGFYLRTAVSEGLWVAVVRLHALPLAGGTCGTRKTRGTFSSFEMPWQEPASIVSNTWLSALALRIVTWAVRFSANGSETLGINPCLAHC